MQLYPAIDLKAGACVRLARGDMNAATVYHRDPAAQAALFFDQGFSYLHIVDLDGAIAGGARNRSAVEGILDVCQERGGKTKCQLGGGIRTYRDAASWLDCGIDRVILGTAALTDPELVTHLAREYPGRVAVAIDTRAGFVAVSGWVCDTKMPAQDLVGRLEDSGVGAIIHTDIERDGVFSGLNLAATRALAARSPVPFIVSGGLAGIEDIRHLLKSENAAIKGAICGRALYDGRLDGRAALALVSAHQAAGKGEGRSRSRGQGHA